MLESGVMVKVYAPVTDVELQVLEQIAMEMRRSRGDRRIGAGNAAGELIALVIKKYPQILSELTASARQIGLPEDDAGGGSPFQDRKTSPGTEDSDNHSVNIPSRRERKAA